MYNFVDLQPYGDNRQLHMIVETPREPKLRAFTVSRALPLGLVFPYDWGFIPGTEGEDGDPIDALAVHDGGTYPGVILPCRPLGVVDLVQKDAKGPIENPRLILMPIWHDRMGELEKAADLPARVKAEIEQFFSARLYLRTSGRR
ncbi:MAG TPA: inorganic diphosphatase [Methylocella sp.]